MDKSRTFHTIIKNAVISMIVTGTVICCSSLLGQTAAAQTVFAGGAHPQQTRTLKGDKASLKPVHNKTISNPVNVLVLGASTAHGWHDTSGNGYLARTFDALRLKQGVAYCVTDRAIPGAKIAEISPKYTRWLRQYHPNVVVISWGLINDLKGKTPYTSFLNSLQKEIDKALQANAKVLLITPPISRYSYTNFADQQEALTRAEIELAQKMRNPAVISIDLFQQMKSTIASDNVPYQLYCASDSAHPNTRGHILAGRLLTADLIDMYGTTSIDKLVPIQNDEYALSLSKVRGRQNFRLQSRTLYFSGGPCWY